MNSKHTYRTAWLPCGQKFIGFEKILVHPNGHVSIPTRFIDIRDWSRKALNFFCHLWYILWELGGNLFLFLRARQRKRFPGNGNSFNRIQLRFDIQVGHQNCCLSIGPQTDLDQEQSILFWTKKFGLDHI